MGHIQTGKFKVVDSSEERKGGPQEGFRRNQVTWSDFPHDSSNKKDMFDFLTNKVANFVFPEGKAVYITSEETVLTACSPSLMPNCCHEEAEARIMVHLLHAL